VRIEQSTRDGCTIITLTGHLDRAAAPHIQQLLLRRLREQPIAVICDLSEVWTLDPACASVFATASHHPASGWTTPKLLLCGAQPAIATMLARLPAPHRLPLHPSVEDAINQAFQDTIDQALNHPSGCTKSWSWRHPRPPPPPPAGSSAPCAPPGT
jgi:anti-anti-sigma regulatory factor